MARPARRVGILGLGAIGRAMAVRTDGKTRFGGLQGALPLTRRFLDRAGALKDPGVPRRGILPT